MQISGYLQTSLIEWPGKIASVIFVPGCNFRCPFCHNRDLVDPSRIRGLKEMSDESIFRDLKKRSKWIDGVVISGGEPLLQADLSRFLSRCKRMGFETMIETNGSLHPILHSIVSKGLVDFVAMDYKTTFENYGEVVRSPSLENSLKTLRGLAEAIPRSGGKQEASLAERIKKSMRLILSSSLPYEFRTTVVPGIHDEKVLIKMAKELRKEVQRCTRPRPSRDEVGKGAKVQSVKWVLQNFQPKNCLDPKFEKKKPYSETEMERFLKAVKKIIPGAELRGV